MVAVANNTIGVKANPHMLGQEQDVVCGTCGCKVAEEHVAVHVAWHALTAANAFPKTVVPTVPAGVS
jgi:hypothetical protein